MEGYFFYSILYVATHLTYLPLIIIRSSRLDVYVKKLFLKVSQNSKKNICIGVSFLIKLQTLGMQLY